MPSLAMVIPAMDIIDDKLNTDSTSLNLCQSIHKAVKLARQTLNRYYAKTDLLNMYQIAMALHPSHKLAYFKKASWERSWIITAEELVHEEFERHYVKEESNSETVGPVDNSVDNASSPKVCEIISPALTGSDILCSVQKICLTTF
jgi:hypothetical protein